MRLAGIVFQACLIDRSSISPCRINQLQRRRPEANLNCDTSPQPPAITYGDPDKSSMNTISIPRARICFSLTLLILAPIAQSAQVPQAGRLRAGAAKVDITPEGPPETIRDRLYARAIYIEDGRSSAAIVTVDAGSSATRSSTRRSPRHRPQPECRLPTISSRPRTRTAAEARLQGRPAGIVAAVNTAKSNAAPARIGYGTAQLDLNVNRDLYNARQEWRQVPNPNGVSDKTLAVVGFSGRTACRSRVYMNYGMHPIDFYQSGLISADFPGEASRNVEELFDGRTVALFSQAAPGDQNPRLGYSPPYSTGAVRRGEGAPVITVAPPGGEAQAAAAAAEGRLPRPPAGGCRRRPQPGARRHAAARCTGSGRNRNTEGAEAIRPSAGAMPLVEIHSAEPYQKVLRRVGDYATMLGQMIGTTAVRVMREDMQSADNAGDLGRLRDVQRPGPDSQGCRQSSPRERVSWI